MNTSEVEIDRLVTWLAATFENENDVTLDDEMALKRIRAEATGRHAAWLAHRDSECVINLPYLAVTAAGATHFEKHFSAQQIAAIFDGTDVAPSVVEGRARRETKKLSAGRRATMYFVIGVIVFVAALLTGIYGFSHREHDAPEQDHKKEMGH